VYRQGDVLIVRVMDFPVSVTQDEKTDVVVLAYGEATGHSHAIHGGNTMVFRGPLGDTFIDVTEHAEVVHQEHAPIPLAPGKYRVVRQREYTPEAIRNVQD